MASYPLIITHRSFAGLGHPNNRHVTTRERLIVFLLLFNFLVRGKAYPDVLGYIAGGCEI